MTIWNGPVPTVSYSVAGGSPHLQALAQALQYTDNEINLINELQKLRLGIVVHEQTLDTVRTSQALGFGPISTPGYPCKAPADSALKRALIRGLAQEATPAMAYELINMREQVKSELQAEQKKAAAAVSGEPPAAETAKPKTPMAAPKAVAAQPLTTLDKSKSVRAAGAGGSTADEPGDSTATGERRANAGRAAIAMWLPRLKKNRRTGRAQRICPVAPG
jgi:hypothetical protein